MERNIFNFIECIETWQGEGPDTGKRMLLVRFKECNLKCPFCDTLVKMRITPSASYTLNQLQSIIDKQACGLMITGGEPTLNGQLQQTVDLLNNLHYPYANVETNGFRLHQLKSEVLPEKGVKYIFSPKIFNEKMFNSNLGMFTTCNKKNLYLKLVISKEEYEEGSWIRRFIERVIDDNPKSISNIYLMPMGITKEELFKNSGMVFDMCEEYKLNFSSRQHIIYSFI